MDPEQIVDFEQFNAKVRSWAAGTEAEMEAGVPVDTGDTKSSISRRYKKSGMTIASIGFPFQRSGIFVEYGAGRGHGGSVGSRWLTKTGERRSTNPDSLGKMNTGSRKAQPWISPALEKKLPELNEIVSGFYAEASARVNQFKIDFKG